MQNKNDDEKPSSVETFEAELTSIKEKGRDLKGTDRDIYNSIVQRLENNEQVLSDLRKEHTDLRTQLKKLTKEKQSRTRSTDLNKEIKHYVHSVTLLKKQIDSLKYRRESAVSRQVELKDQLNNLTRDDESDKSESLIVSLKNKLDNAEIKNKETEHLIKVYNSIKYQLERQKMRWNSSVEDAKKDVKQKKRDLADLELIARDSQHSKNSAYLEFNNLRERVANAHEQREFAKEKKKRLVQQNVHIPISNDGIDSRTQRTQQSLNSQASVVRHRNNRAARDKKDEKLRMTAAKVDDIKEFFGTSDPQEIKEFFDERRATTETLSKQIDEIKEECSGLEKKVAQRKSAIEEAEYTSAKGVGGARLINEAKKILTKSSDELREAERMKALKQEFKRSIENGVYHLTDEMELVQKEPVEFDSTINAIRWVKETISSLKNEIDGEDFDPVAICNTQVIAEKMAAESEFNIQEVDSSMRVQKPRIDMVNRRNAKGDKGEFVSRVQDSKAVKAAALKAALAKKEQLAKKKNKDDY